MLVFYVLFRPSTEWVRPEIITLWRTICFPQSSPIYMFIFSKNTPNGHIKLSKRCISLLMTRPTQIWDGLFMLSVKTLPFPCSPKHYFVPDSSRSATGATRHFPLSAYTKANKWPEKTVRNDKPKNSLILEKGDEKHNLISLHSKWQINKELMHSITYNSQLQFYIEMT